MLVQQSISRKSGIAECHAWSILPGSIKVQTVVHKSSVWSITIFCWTQQRVCLCSEGLHTRRESYLVFYGGMLGQSDRHQIRVPSSLGYFSRSWSVDIAILSKTLLNVYDTYIKTIYACCSVSARRCQLP